jgi:hypothetical protein
MALRLFPHVAFASEPDSVRITLHDGAGFLLHPSASKTVSRVVVPLIVLTLTAARSGALSCITQCAFPATSADCAHQSASHPAAARADRCDPVAAAAIAVSRDETRRGAAARDTSHAVVVPRSFVGRRPVMARATDDAGPRRLIESRPRTLALRI